MSIHLIRRILWLVSATCVALSVAAVWWAFAPQPVIDGTGQASGDFDKDAIQVIQEPVIPQLEQLRRAAKVVLRQRLYDPPPPQVQPPPPPPPLTVKYEGSIIEPGRSVAMFSTPNGSFIMRRVGEMAEQVKVLAITAETVTVRHGQRDITLTTRRPSGTQGSPR